MAGDWIKMRVNLVNDPAVRAIARALKMDAFSVVGRLHAFWSWADEHTEDGALTFTTSDDIDELVGKRGFSAQLSVVGWLNGESGAYRLPNFERHNGDSAKRRVLETEKKRRQRNAALAAAPCPDSVPEITGQKRDSVPVLAGPEKRREEKSITILPTPAAPADPRHRQICDQWGPQFTKAFRIDYRFDPKDAATLKRFLKGSNDSPGDFLSVASKAWDRSKASAFAKRCKEAATIHGLCTYYNEIRVELQTQTATPDKSVAGFAR